MPDLEMPTIVEAAISPGTLWLVEVWNAFRPYLIKLSVDFVIFVGIWGVLLAAHALTTALPLGTKLSDFLVGFHETMVVITFVWLSLVATWDLISLRRKG